MAAPPRRVAVTGLGAVTPAGRDVASFREALFAGVSLARPSSSHAYPVATVADDAPRADLDPEAARLLGRCSRFAADAAIQAALDARVPVRPETLPLMAVVIGSERGEEESLLRWTAATDPAERALWRRRASLPPGTAVARTLAAAGPCRTLTGDAAAGLAAVAEGADLILRGEAAFVFCGGADAPLAGLAQEAADPSGGPSPASVAPGEGAVVFVLEELSLALQRGATVYAEMPGWSETFSRSPVATPGLHRVDASRALKAALMRGHTLQSEVDAVFASAAALHGSGAEAFRLVWGRRAQDTPVTAPDGVLGHLLAASGPASMLAALLAMGAGAVPPAPGFEAARGARDVATGRRELPLRRVVVNAFGPGHNVSIVLAAHDSAERM